ncbi:MAG: RNA polymerase sporulation sigma factor SigG [Clostridia bacterium]|nr:RNA polymerase sporulation sigma factor SigG [Clostridia bacterium]
MYNKVSICGVDTASLPSLKEEEKEKLLISVKKGDKKARERLVNCNLRLVLSVVKKFSMRGENPDDLFQVGCVGLIKSIDNFDVSQNVKFSTYAVPMIIGEIRRYLRDNNSVRVSRSIKDTAYHAMRTKEKFINDYGREPTVSEIANIMNAKREDIVIALESIVEPISIYEPVFSDSGDTVYILDQLGDKNDDRCWLEEIFLKETIKSLSLREKSILNKRFIEGKTQTEVSKEIGISQAQVSRIEKCAINKIKS